jgi:hypothetical protein
MNNKLQLIQKAPRLTATWVNTGDAKRPLACIWAAATARPAVTAPSDFEAGRLPQCA